MKSIHKYPIVGLNECRVTIKGLVKLLCVQAQGNAPMLWALVDYERFDQTEVRLVTFGTGERITRDVGEYLGTYQLNDGRLVFHVFVAGE